MQIRAVDDKTTCYMDKEVENMGMTIDDAIQYGADALEANIFLKDTTAFYDFLAISLDTMRKYRWIPVSERLPKAEYGESDSVLVCFENGTQDVLYFDGSNWRYTTGESYISVNHKNGWHNKVIAWMPLPTAYSEVEK